jgi:hypothetical protein
MPINFESNQRRESVSNGKVMETRSYLERIVHDIEESEKEVKFKADASLQ